MPRHLPSLTDIRHYRSNGPKQILRGLIHMMHQTKALDMGDLVCPSNVDFMVPDLPETDLTFIVLLTLLEEVTRSVRQVLQLLPMLHIMDIQERVTIRELSESFIRGSDELREMINFGEIFQVIGVLTAEAIEARTQARNAHLATLPRGTSVTQQRREYETEAAVLEYFANLLKAHVLAPTEA
jgi:hypothetical protein